MSGFDLPPIGTPGTRPGFGPSPAIGPALGSALDAAQGPRPGPPLLGDSGRPAPVTAAGEGAPFGGMLADAIDRVDQLQRDVRLQTQALATGQPVALHDIMLSMGKSEVAFNLMLEVRNKLVDAWEKLSRAVV